MRLLAGLPLLLLFACGTVSAQPLIQAPLPKDPNQPDPLAAFMVPQPPIDTRSPIQVTTEFDPPRVAAGTPAVYRLTLTVLDQDVDWPETVPFPDDWEVRRGARAQLLQSVGPSILPRTTLLFHVVPRSAGLYSVPMFEMTARGEKASVPPARLEVLPAGISGLAPPTRIRIAPPSGALYAGQSVPLEVLLPARADGTVQTLAQTQIEGEDILVDRTYVMQRVETRVLDGRPVPTFIYQALLTPLRPGAVELRAQGFTFGSTPTGQIIISGGAILSGGQPTYTLVDSEPLTLHIRPLPEADRPGHFDGAIGSFTVDPPVLSTNRLRTGDLLTLTVVVRGQGNLERLTPPPIPASPEWQVLPPRREAALPALIRQRGFTTFEYRLIPLTEEITRTPAIPFCAFNPATGAYEDLSLAPMDLVVDPGSMTIAPVGTGTLTEARKALLNWSRHEAPPERLGNDVAHPGRAARSLAPLHQQAGFILLQLAPGTLLAGLWVWDKRRRYLEQHPEVVLRQKARRAVRRHARAARRAAGRGDGERFLNSAIAGLREACAPRKPAEPLALAGCDVIPELAAETEAAHRLAQRLFEAANTSRFGNRPQAPENLLALAPEVDETLDHLRRKL